MAFSLESISKTKKATAPKIVIGGPGKIGKTTFAASSPNSIGILTEDGASAVDAHAFPLCKSLEDVYSAIGVLLNEEHQFASCWLDSLDWCEPLLQDYVCRRNGWSSIESPGFGKGYIAASDEWRTLLAGFEQLRAQRGMAIILIVHDKIKHFESPMHDGYDQYVIKLHDRASALVTEWADVIGWAGYKVMTKSNDAGFGQKEHKAITTGERILHVEPHPAHFGGNRFGMKNIPLTWDSFTAEISRVMS